MTTSRSFYLARVEDFLTEHEDAIIGQMAARLAALHNQAENDQIRAWRHEIRALKQAFEQLSPASLNWSILFETPILRLGRRIDALVLMPGIVVVIEFKTESKNFEKSAIRQTEDYALMLRDFHSEAQLRTIVPILCTKDATSTALRIETIFEGVSTTLLTNISCLDQALSKASQAKPGLVTPISADAFEKAAYKPTPTIIEAARSLYRGHEVSEIGRQDAAAEILEKSSQRLTEIVERARSQQKRIICFVTGTPGAGKTLLGLNLALRSRVAGAGLPPASLLSGNPPLVHVLVEALAEDAHKHKKIKKADTRREAQSAIQGLLGFLREHGDDTPPPPEHVIVFDEAQRAWDADVGLKLLGRKMSEPAYFLDIFKKKDWACLVCLVGPGQEINRGEGGLALWGEALSQAANQGTAWEIWAAPQAIAGGPDVGSNGLATHTHVCVSQDPALHLSSSMRAYRNPDQIRWVNRLLHGDLGDAALMAAQMQQPPALISRDLEETKAWLRQHRRGNRSVGMLAASGAVRLIAEGLPPAPRSNELDAIGHWFLKPSEDFRSSGALETPLSEFGCQGLELDYVGLCWGGDLIWNGGWIPRRMASPKWQIISATDRAQYRINSYRVLLTRARLGTIIYIPKGSDEDATRSRLELDTTAEALIKAGCRYL